MAGCGLEDVPKVREPCKLDLGFFLLSASAAPWNFVLFGFTRGNAALLFRVEAKSFFFSSLIAS